MDFSLVSRWGRLAPSVPELLLAAVVAAWLLWHPETIQGLPLGLRLPLVLLGLWALGMAFVRPLSMDIGSQRLQRLSASPLSRGALWLFAVLLVGQELLG